MKRFVLCIAFAIALCGVVAAQDQGAVTAPAEMKFGPLPNIPPCLQGAILRGDPAKTGITAQLKGTAGCRVPWHWHTAVEQLGMVSGNARLEIKGTPARTIGPGAYAYMPAKHQHDFTCVTACVLFIGSDGPFDVHYVDASGKEITPEAAPKSGAKMGAAKAATKAPAK